MTAKGSTWGSLLPALEMCSLAEETFLGCGLGGKLEGEEGL